MPQAKTRTEFLRNVRERNFAHHTYDIVSAAVWGTGSVH